MGAPRQLLAVWWRTSCLMLWVRPGIGSGESHGSRALPARIRADSARGPWLSHEPIPGRTRRASGRKCATTAKSWRGAPNFFCGHVPRHPRGTPECNGALCRAHPGSGASKRIRRRHTPFPGEGNPFPLLLSFDDNRQGGSTLCVGRPEATKSRLVVNGTARG